MGIERNDTGQDLEGQREGPDPVRALSVLGQHFRIECCTRAATEIRPRIRGEGGRLTAVSDVQKGVTDG